MPKSTPQFMDANAANNPAAAAVMSSAAPGSGAPPGSTAAGTTTTSQPQPQQQPQQPSTAQLATSEGCIAILEEVLSKVEPFVSTCNTLPTSPHMANLRTLVENLALARNSKEVSHIVKFS